ncbi:MAG TPA: hypothetical protein DCM05_00025, partial [Elusimicrobia bacterium]|nr:hypothetical protein [Elusimicrobiota bacterium]
MAQGAAAGGAQAHPARIEAGAALERVEGAVGVLVLRAAVLRGQGESPEVQARVNGSPFVLVLAEGLLDAAEEDGVSRGCGHERKQSGKDPVHLLLRGWDDRPIIGLLRRILRQKRVWESYRQTRVVLRIAGDGAGGYRIGMKGSPALSVVTRRAHLVTFLGALLACIAVVMWMVGPYLLSLFLGGTLAMLAYPAQQWLRARRWGARLAAAAVTALLVLLVIAPLTGFSILSVKQGIAIGRELAELKEFSPKALTAALSRRPFVRSVLGDPQRVAERLRGAIQAVGEVTHAAVLKLGKGVPEFLLQLVLALVAFFFFLLDGERFMDWLLGLGALDRNVQERLVEAFRDTAISSVLAGLAAAASQAVLISVGFLLLDVPGAFLAGGLTFIFAWIPLVGSAPASLAGMLYLYAQGSTIKLALMAALALAASVVDNLVRPMVLSGRAGMHPLVGFVGIISGIQMFGILGVFIGPILAAMLLSLLRIWPAIGGRIGIDSAASRAAVKAALGLALLVSPCSGWAAYQSKGFPPAHELFAPLLADSSDPHFAFSLGAEEQQRGIARVDLGDYLG